MRNFDAATVAYLTSQTGLMARTLMWISARDRVSGAIATMGLWNGDDHQDFTIGGQTRTYYGAGALLAIEDLTYQTGVAVRMHRVTLSPLTPEVTQAIRGYDVRMAPVEIHRALFRPDSHALVAEPHRVFKGYVETLQITTPEVGGEAGCDVTIASSARTLTRTLPAKKSDETQKRRQGDRLRRYADISASVDVYWGEKRAVAAAPPPASQPGSGGGHGFKRNGR